MYRTFSTKSRTVTARVKSFSSNKITIFKTFTHNNKRFNRSTADQDTNRFTTNTATNSFTNIASVHGKICEKEKKNRFITAQYTYRFTNALKILHLNQRTPLLTTVNNRE